MWYTVSKTSKSGLAAAEGSMSENGLRAVVVAVNAQYQHTGLGARSIWAYARRETGFEVSLLEVTVNHREADVLERLVQRRAEAYLFSCYLWNIGMILRLVQDLRLLRPDAAIVLGGPEVGYREPGFLDALPQADVIVTGEGEETVCQLLRLLAAGKPLDGCPGIIRRAGGRSVATAKRPPLHLDTLAFPYPDLDELTQRTLYYESMRGCPFACSYCTSSIERGVRRRSLPLVFADLAVFLERRVRQVKFVDRTFNADPAHARAIWAWLSAHDNGVTNFHFELSGELLEAETLTFLAGVRPGLFQFEIGVQTVTPEALREIDRPADVPRLLDRVRRLLAPGNIHVHLDLIAGLPYETPESFQESFNRVYACGPHQLQLGFLKVLSGSKMERMAGAYGLLYSASAPYPALRTRWMDYETLCLLRGVARMVETYHNSGRFARQLSWLTARFLEPFTLFRLLWLYYDAATEGRPVSEREQSELLAGFAESRGIEITGDLRWLARYDLLRHEKPRRLPVWVAADLSSAYRKQIRRFFRDPENVAAYLPEYLGEAATHVERMAHLEVFPFDPAGGERKRTALLFNYRRRDMLGAAHVRALPMAVLEGE